MIAKTITDRTIDRTRKRLDDFPKRRLHVQYLRVEHGMNKRLRFWKTAGKQWMSLSREHHDVLLIEPLHRVGAQDLRTNRIDRLIVMLLESLYPIGKKLRIDMARARRTGNCGGKKHAWSCRDQVLHQAIGPRRREVLGDFQAYRKVKDPTERKRLCQVARQDNDCWGFVTVPVKRNLRPLPKHR